MPKFMIIGPLTRDRITKKNKVFDTIGGGVYYQSAVFSGFGIDNTVITTLAMKDKNLLNQFPEATQIIPIYTEETMEFENIYPDDNPNHRIQRSTVPKNQISPIVFKDLNFKHYDALLLSPLSPSDIPLKTIQYLHKQDIPIYMGAQGYLRNTENNKVVLKPWKDYKIFLKLVDFLFLDELEARAILRNPTLNCAEISQRLSAYGPEEVIVTRGNRGALIYSRSNGEDNIYDSPAFPPKKIVDPTGLGDTFMAAYAIKKQETKDPRECGKFASYISSIKLEQRGAFRNIK